MNRFNPKSIINNLARLVRGSSQSTQPNTLRPLGRPVGESDSGRLASRLANRRSSQSPQQSPHILRDPQTPVGKPSNQRHYDQLANLRNLQPPQQSPPPPPPIGVRKSSEERTQEGKVRINQYLNQNYDLNITDGEDGSSIQEGEIEKIQSMSLHDLNELKNNINLYNMTFKGSDDFIQPLKSAINQTIDLKLPALTLKKTKSPEDKKMIVDLFCQRFDINLKETVTDALEHLAIIFDKETTPTLDDIVLHITQQRIYESFDYWAPVAYDNITDPFMDENIKPIFPDVLTQKLFDQIPADTFSKIEHTAERNHYNVTLNETSITIPDDGVCFFHLASLLR